MITEITIPSGDNGGAIFRVNMCLRQSGDFVLKDMDILEIETDKCYVTIVAPHEGTLTLCVSEGDETRTETILGFVDDNK
jgi:pyruvate/2-oxoglutarate dehydrogenase complex dihydrolipoamide acyltransferase (E2) component